MLKQKIKCHRIGMQYEKPHFFILSKGSNSGRPMPEYCANCFVFIADSVNEKEHYFYLCNALWKGGYFKRFLTGSVIPFIRIDDLVNIIKEAALKVDHNAAEYMSSIDYIKKLDEHSENLKKQIDLIKQMKKALLYKILR